MSQVSPFKRFRKQFKLYLRYVVVEAVHAVARIAKAPFSFSTDPRPKLLVVVYDAIGDYILWRNYFEVLRNSEKFRGYRIVVANNSLWRKLSEIVDAPYIDEFIWVDFIRFRNRPLYQFQILRQFQRLRFDTVIVPVHSREYVIDKMVWSISAKEKVAFQAESMGWLKFVREKSDAFYTTLIPPPTPDRIFMFYRYGEMVRTVTNSELPDTRIHINATMVSKPSAQLADSYVVLFPGASTKFKRWDPARFALIAEYLHDAGLQVVIAGGNKDYNYAEAVQKAAPLTQMLDLTGRTTLAQLVSLLAGARLLVSNDTSPVHIAAAVETPVVCIAKQDVVGRYVPWPRALSQNMDVIFPENPFVRHVNEVSTEAVLAAVAKRMEQPGFRFG
jgi:ADP-heptose:LPS heptosyltransferase